MNTTIPLRAFRHRYAALPLLSQLYIDLVMADRERAYARQGMQSLWEVERLTTWHEMISDVERMDEEEVLSAISELRPRKLQLRPVLWPSPLAAVI